jgi:hypothetical protein
MNSKAYDEAAARQDPAVRLSPAFIAAATEVRPLVIQKYPTWRDIPGIMRSSEAVDKRLAAMSAGTRARVDFKRVFAKFAKGRLAAFEPGLFSIDVFRYTRPVGDQLAVAVEWRHKSGVGIGKMLELSIGARWNDKTAVILWPLPMFFGFAHAADWTYGTKEELEGCLAAGADVVDLLVPPLGEALARNMAAAEIPGGIGAATAREALEIARRQLASAGGNLKFAGAELRYTRCQWGPPIATDGRIRAHAEWMMRFVAASGDGMVVHAAHIGAPLVLQFFNGVSPLEPVPEVFVDSSETLRGVAGDVRFPENAVFTGMTLGDQRPYIPEAGWRVDFIVPNTVRRGLAWVHAADGRVVYPGP